MKKFLTIVTIAITLISLTSCGNRSSKVTTDNETEVCDTAVVDTVAVDTVVVEQN